MDTSQNFPIIIPQGATVIRTINYQNSDEDPINLTDYTAAMQFRDTVESSGSPVINLTTENGGIVIDELNGSISFTISSTITADLEDGLELAYDLFIYSGTGIATRLLAGTATVSGSVTR